MILPEFDRDQRVPSHERVTFQFQRPINQGSLHLGSALPRPTFRRGSQGSAGTRCTPRTKCCQPWDTSRVGPDPAPQARVGFETR